MKKYLEFFTNLPRYILQIIIMNMDDKKSLKVAKARNQTL